MAIWQVIADKIKLFSHPNADKMQLGKVGAFQVVIGKGQYSDGDIVIFAPERSILPEKLRPFYTNSETGKSYLVGTDHDRVSRVRLRGEYSEGVIIPIEAAYCKWDKPEDITLGIDLSELFGITKYEPPLPTSFAGQLEHIDTVADFRQHDVEQFRLYQNEFAPGEPVIVTEKIHGSQINILRDANGKEFVTSKGMAGKHVAIVEDDKNIYWKAVRNTKLFDVLNNNLAGANIQIMGEVIPCQGVNYSYGQDSNKPTLRIFRLIIDGKDYGNPYHLRHPVWEYISNLWVPLIYSGPYNVDALVEASKGMEQVSGKQLHIREGIVVAPESPRLSSEGFPLLLKIINPRYKETGEELS